MKTTLTALITAALFAASANAAVITVSATAPTVDGADVANLVADTGGFSAWSDRGVAGQTFTTGATPGDLVALTVKITVGDGSIDGWKDWSLRFGTVDALPGTLTIVGGVDEVVRHNPDETSPAFFTFTLDTPIALAANTTYAFDVGVDGSQEGWQAGIPTIRSAANTTYTGGQAYTGAKPADFPNYSVSGQNSDLIFHADIIPIPEPASLALLGLGGLMIARRRS